VSRKYNWGQEWLYNEHIVEGKSINKIADEQGVGWSTVRKHLRKNDIPIQKHGTSNKQYPNLSPSPELAYILGVLDGDGYVSGCIQIALGVKDEVFAQEFANALQAIGLRAKVRKYDYWVKNLKRQEHRWVCNVNSVVFVRWYKGLTQERKEGIAKQFPEEYLKGMFESEGSYNINPDGSAYVWFSNFDYNLLLMVQRLLTMLGYESKIYKSRHKSRFSGREVTEYKLGLLGSSKEKYEFIKRIKPVIKNQPYDYSDPNGLRGHKPKPQKEVQSDDLPNCGQI